MNKINPNHQNQRSALKLIGPIMLGIGIIFIAVGVISFFSAFGSFESPKYFWCCFVGVPLMGIGARITKYAYMEKIARYSAGELAPVAKDVIRYLKKDTSDNTKKTPDSSILNNQSKIGSVEERIEKLKKLKEKGIIDAEDFEEQKDRILTEI